MKARSRIQKFGRSPNRRKRDSSRPLREHRTKTAAQGRRLASLLRQTVDKLLPANAKVLILSKGDENLLRLNTCRGAHFPQDPSGRHARYCPASSSAAIAHLEALRFKGAEYLVVPAPASAWFETYPEFKRHLERRYALIDQTPELFT